MSEMTSIVGESVDLPQETAAPETPAVETAAPVEQAAEPEAQAEQPAADPRVVPLAALHEERSKRRELAAELAEAKRAREEMERRVEQRLAMLQQATQPQPPAPPSLEENPVGHFSHQINQLAQTQQQLLAQSQAERQAAAQAAMESQLAARVQQAEAAFVAQQPDYLDAVRHMHDVRTRELQALGVDEFAAERQSVQELRQFAFVMAQQGRSPAEVAYNLAKVRGYTPKAQQVQVTPSEKMQMAQRGTAAASSLGNGSGGGGSLSAKALLSMSDDEFAEATSGGKWQKLMGAS